MTNYSPTKNHPQDQTQALALVTPPRRKQRYPTKSGRNQPLFSSVRFLPDQLTLPVINQVSVAQTDIVQYADYIEEADDDLFKRGN